MEAQAPRVNGRHASMDAIPVQAMHAYLARTRAVHWRAACVHPSA